MKYSIILWVLLFLILTNGCERKENNYKSVYPNINVSDNLVTNDIGHENIFNDMNTVETEVGITLLFDPSIYNRIVYVDRNVTGLYFSTSAVIGINGLEQLKFLDTIVFNRVSNLNDFSFLEQLPQIKRIFIDYQTQNINWSFIEKLPNLEVLSVSSYRQSIISIDLKNNKNIEYIEFTSGILKAFPTLLNIPDSLLYLNLEGNNITSLPKDFDKYHSTTIILSINPFEKDNTTPSNVTLEFASEIILDQKYYIPTNMQYIRGANP